MTWTRIGSELPDNPRMLTLPRGVRYMHVEAMIWCNKQGTDGMVPAAALPRITDEPDPAAAAGKLVEAGMWEATAAGWHIVDFLRDQPSREDVERQAELNRQRVRRSRLHGAGDHSECTDWCRQKRAQEQLGKPKLGEPKLGKPNGKKANGVPNGITAPLPNGVANGVSSNGAEVQRISNAISNAPRSVRSVRTVPIGEVKDGNGLEGNAAATAADSAGATSARPLQVADEDVRIADVASEEPGDDAAELALCWAHLAADVVGVWATAGDVAEERVDGLDALANGAFRAAVESLRLTRADMPDLRVSEAGRYRLEVPAEAAEAWRALLLAAVRAELAGGHAALAG